MTMSKRQELTDKKIIYSAILIWFCIALFAGVIKNFTWFWAAIFAALLGFYGLMLMKKRD